MSASRMTGSAPGVTHVTTSQASASSRAPTSQPSSPASRPAASGSGSKQTPGPYSASARQRAAHIPGRPQPTIPTLAASGLASSWAATGIGSQREVGSARRVKGKRIGAVRRGACREAQRRRRPGEQLQTLLRSRYPQLGAMQIADYPVIAVRIERATSWGNLTPDGAPS